MMKSVVIALAAVVAGPASAAIICLKVHATATAKWTNNATKACTWMGTVGSNFGTDVDNDGE